MTGQNNASPRRSLLSDRMRDLSRASLLIIAGIMGLKLLCGSTSAGEFFSDFDFGPPARATLFGTAQVGFSDEHDSALLKLTINDVDQQGSLVIGDLDAGQPVASFYATFKLLMWQADSLVPAEGFSFNFANDLPEGSFGEEGAGNGITIAFDTFNNAGDNAPAIDVKFAGEPVFHRDFGIEVMVAPYFVEVSIELDNGRLTVLFGDITVCANLDTGYTPTSGRFGLGARTGASFSNQWIDDLDITTTLVALPRVNDAPAFTRGPDVTANEDAGAQNVSGWATGISPGVTNESNQTLSFQISNNNPSLFSVQPLVDPITGTLSFTAGLDANGSAIVTLSLRDNGGTANGGVDTSAPQNFTITVNAANDAPSFNKGAEQTATDNGGPQTRSNWATAISPGPTNESGQGVDFQVNNDNTSLFLIQPAISADGTLSFTPAHTGGAATVIVRLHDNGGTANGGVDLSAVQSFTITVQSVNNAPTFTRGPDLTANEDAGAQSVSGWSTGISPGSPDESSQTLSFQITNNNPSLFSVQPSVDASTGTLSFTAGPEANGSAMLTLSLRDDAGTANGGADTSAPQNFTITVTPVNDAPSFNKGAEQTSTDNGGPQTRSNWATAISPGPTNESGQAVDFQVSNDNTSLFVIQPAISSAGTLSFTPAPSGGTATVIVRLQDNGGTANGGVDLSAAQSFTITVQSVNNAPTFTRGPDLTVNEDAGAQSVSGWAAGISPGSPNESSQTLSFQISNNNPSLFSVQPSVDASTGTLSFTAGPDANGSAIVTLSLHDNAGTANGGADTSARQNFTITVNSVNDAPSFNRGAEQTVSANAPQTRSNWATAISPGPTNESGQAVDFQVNNDNTSLFLVQPAISADGTLSFTPANIGGTATMIVSLRDNGGTANGGVDLSAAQSFTITIQSVNEAPTFTRGPDLTVNEDASAQSVSGWATGISPGSPNESSQTLSFQIGNINPSLFSVQPSVDAITGTLSFTAGPEANGSAIVTLSLHDNAGTANGGADTSARQNFTITVNSVNDAPSFNKGAEQTVSANAGPQTRSNWATAISPGPTNESGQAVDFQVSTDNTSLFLVQPAISADGTLSFTPANTGGTGRVIVRLHDNGSTANGGVDLSAAQTFTITVQSVNNAPTFTKGRDTTANEDAGAQSISGWATGISPGELNESNQTLSFQISNNNPSLFSVQPSVDASTGTLSFTAGPDANGSTIVTLSLRDNAGAANGGADISAPQNFTITVDPVNDAPGFSKGAEQTVSANAGPQTRSNWATAISPGPTNESGQAVDFQVSTDNTSLFLVQPAISAAGTLSFTPANASGTARVIVRLHDNGGTANGGVDLSATQSFTITVQSVNNALTFTRGPDLTVNEDAGAQSISGWATGLSPGSPNESSQTLSFQISNNNPSLFSVQPSVDPSTGTLNFTAGPDANGSAIITLSLHDNAATANGGADSSAPQNFTITVNSVNDAPSFNKGAEQTVSGNGGLQTRSNWATDISRGPTNESGQTLDFQVSNDNTSLFLVQPAISAGTLSFTPANTGGTATVIVRLHDNGGAANGGIDLSATQRFTITVQSVNEAPTFTRGPDLTVNEDAGARSISGWATGMSPGSPNESSQALSFQISNSNPSLFSVQPSVDARTGTLSFTSGPGANGSAVLTLNLRDNAGTANGGADTSPAQNFTIIVNPVNDAPSFSKGAEQTVSANGGPQTRSNWATAISPGPTNESGQAVDFQVSNDNTSLFLIQPAISPNGTLSFSLANTSGTARVIVRLHDNGTTVNGGVDLSAAQTFTITAQRVNNALTFIRGPDITANEDVGAQSVSGWATGISPGSPNESSQTLSFQIGNNNPSLFSVQPSVDASTGTLSFTAGPDANGSAIVTLSLRDNRGTLNGAVDISPPQNFTITVNPVNDPPTISNIANQNVPQDSIGSLIGFNLGDVDTSLSSLIVSASSSNTTLVADANIAFTGAGSARAIMISPNKGQLGETKITLSVSDGSLTATDTFLVSVLELPKIVKQPQSQTVTAGATVTLEIEVTGAGPFAYQWRLNGANISGATDLTLRLPSVQPANSGSYSVAFISSSGDVSSEEANLTVLAPIRPPGDDFAERALLAASSGIVSGDNTGATQESGEPMHAGKAGGRSVWYRWVAPDSGIAHFHTRGSNFDTLLAIYVGSSVGALEQVASDEDRGGFLTSRVAFNALAGTEYQVAIDGFGRAEGNLVLSWMLERTFEDIPEIATSPRSQAAPLGSRATFSVTARGTGLQYQWLFDGVPLPRELSNSLTLPNVQPANVGDYSVQVIRGTRRIDSARARLELIVAETAEGTPLTLSEDKLEDLMTLTPSVGLQKASLVSGKPSSRGYTLRHLFNTQNATRQKGEPNHCGGIGGASQWFALTNALPGNFTVSTVESEFETVIAVYTLPQNKPLQMTNLVLETCDRHGSESRVHFSAQAGTTYYVAIDGVDAGKGQVELKVEFEVPVQFQNPQRLANGHFRVRLLGRPGLSQTIESSTDLQEWKPLLTTASQDGDIDFEDPDADNLESLFYRAVPAP